VPDVDILTKHGVCQKTDLKSDWMHIRSKITDSEFTATENGFRAKQSSRDVEQHCYGRDYVGTFGQNGLGTAKYLF